MLIAAIFKSTYYYTLAFSPQQHQHGNKDTQALKQGLLPPSLGKMKSPSATSSSPPRPPRKSLTLQKAEKVWLLSILLRNMSSRMSATAGTGTVTFFYYVMQNDNIRRKKTSIQLDHFCGFFIPLARLGEQETAVERPTFLFCSKCEGQERQRAAMQILVFGHKSNALTRWWCSKEIEENSLF